MQPMFNTAPPDGRSRVIIENVTPEVDGGTFAVKRVRCERVIVEADIFADGHEVPSRKTSKARPLHIILIFVPFCTAPSKIRVITTAP